MRTARFSKPLSRFSLRGQHLSQHHGSLCRLPPTHRRTTPRRSGMRTARSHGGWSRQRVFGHTASISGLMLMEVVKRMGLIVVIPGVAREKEAGAISRTIIGPVATRHAFLSRSGKVPTNMCRTVPTSMDLGEGPITPFGIAQISPQTRKF